VRRVDKEEVVEAFVQELTKIVRDELKFAPRIEEDDDPTLARRASDRLYHQREAVLSVAKRLGINPEVFTRVLAEILGEYGYTFHGYDDGKEVWVDERGYTWNTDDAYAWCTGIGLEGDPELEISTNTVKQNRLFCVLCADGVGDAEHGPCLTIAGNGNAFVCQDCGERIAPVEQAYVDGWHRGFCEGERAGQFSR
jgi:hypothetical protein